MGKSLFNQTIAFDLYLRSQYNSEIKNKLNNYLQNTTFSNYIYSFSLNRFFLQFIAIIILAVLILVLDKYQIILLSNSEFLQLIFMIIFIFFLMNLSFLIAYLSFFLIMRIVAKLFQIDNDGLHITVEKNIVEIFNIDIMELFDENCILKYPNQYLQYFILEILIVFSFILVQIVFIKKCWNYILIFNTNIDAYIVLIILFILFFSSLVYLTIFLSLFMSTKSHFRTIIEILRSNGIEDNLNFKFFNLNINIRQKLLNLLALTLLYSTIFLFPENYISNNYSLMIFVLIFWTPIITILILQFLNYKLSYKVQVAEMLLIFILMISNFLNIVDLNNLIVLGEIYNFYLFSILILLLLSIIFRTIETENSWKYVVDSLKTIRSGKNSGFIQKNNNLESYKTAIYYSNGPLFSSEHESVQKILKELNLKELFLNLKKYYLLSSQKELTDPISFDNISNAIINENLPQIHSFKVQFYENLNKNKITIIHLKHYTSLLKEIINNPEKILKYIFLIALSIFIINTIREEGIEGLITAVKIIFNSNLE